MSTDHATGPVTHPSDEQFAEASKKGWAFFTKFLLGNVIATLAALIFVGLLTVWS
jgi:hypothetical protein